MLPTFTTNSINILAGINGVEVIQAFIIALSVLLNDMLYLPVWPASFLEFWNIQNPEEGKILDWAAGEVVQRHLMSAYFMAPLVGVCAGFLWHNWYASQRFTWMSTKIQVPSQSISRGYILLFHRNGFFSSRYPRSFLKDFNLVLYPSDIQLYPLVSTTVSPRTLSTTSITCVSYLCHSLELD